MTIVTLTTDFGTQDHYVAALKGAMLSRDRNLYFVDVSHNIESHNLVQAAFIFKNTWYNFPEGTIHILSVSNHFGGQPRFLVFEHLGHFFIGPDNGIFSLVFETTYSVKSFLPNTKMYELPFGGLTFAPIREILSFAVSYITQHDSIASVGEPAADIYMLINRQPVITQNSINGSVIYVDNYANVVVNISHELFMRVGNNRNFQLFFRRNEPITRLSSSYNDVEVGEVLCLFNSDYLEIAVNMGKTAELLSLKVEDTVQIIFE